MMEKVVLPPFKPRRTDEEVIKQCPWASTGKPKGVMQPHSSLRAFLAWRIHDLKFTPESRNAQHASFSFDASLDDLLCPLAAGGSVYIMPEEIRKDVNAMCQYLFDNGITGMTLSTQLGMTMLGLFNNLPLRYLMMGGEKMLPSQKKSSASLGYRKQRCFMWATLV